MPGSHARPSNTETLKTGPGMGVSESSVGGSNVQPGWHQPLAKADHHHINHGSTPFARDWVKNCHVAHFGPMTLSGKPAKPLLLLIKKPKRQVVLLPLNIVVSSCDSWDGHGHVTTSPEGSQPMDGRAEMARTYLILDYILDRNPPTPGLPVI